MINLQALCVIPAKGRSSRFPGKNLALLGGKPLVVWAVEAAYASGVFDLVMVSTDDPAIAQISAAAGAEVPFSRDPALSADTVEVPAVVRQALEWYRDQRQTVFEAVCTLQTTSPLRTPDDIRKSKALLDGDPQADAVISVSRYHHHPYWALRLEGRKIIPAMPDQAVASRQNLPDLYHPDGTVDWRRSRMLLEGRTAYDGCVLAYHAPPESVLDIDYPEDLQLAQARLAHRT